MLVLSVVSGYCISVDDVKNLFISRVKSVFKCFFYTGEDILIYFSSYELTLFALMVCISSVVAVNVLEFCVLPTRLR